MSYQQPPGYPPPGQGFGQPQGYVPPPNFNRPPSPPPKQYMGWKIAGGVVGGLILLRACGAVLGLGSSKPPSSQSNNDPPHTAQAAERPKPQSEPRPQPRPQPKPPEEEKAMVVSIGELLGSYKDNEIRSDAAYKGKLIQTTGIVGDVKKDILGDIYVTLGTGAAFEIPTVQCFFEKDQTDAVAALSKGNKVTITGRVSGLMMNVLVKKCVLVK